MKLLATFIFWCLWFLNFSTRTVFAPLLPLIEDSFSLSHGQAGGLFTSLSIGYGISLFMAGWFTSVWGYKKTVVTGFIGIVVDRVSSKIMGGELCRPSLYLLLNPGLL